MIRPPRIQTSGLSHAYEPGITAIQDISITLEPGAFAALIGQNGSGKTTLVKHFNGLLRPTAGEVLFDGDDIRDRSLGELAALVGYVFQNPDHQIFAATVREEIGAGPRNLGLSEGDVQHRIEDSLARFGLGDVAEQQPAMLGYGLRRKISVAAVYAMRPPVLILDEPTTGLDWHGIEDLMGLVCELHRQGHTILLITHDMRVVTQYAPETILLHGGQLSRFDRTSLVFQDIGALVEMGIRIPPIVKLGGRMIPQGLPSGVITVDGFYRAWTSLLETLEAR